MNALLKQVFCVETTDITGNPTYRISLTKTGSVIQAVGVACIGAAGTLLASGFKKTSIILLGIGSALTGAGNGLTGIGKRNAMK